MAGSAALVLLTAQTIQSFWDGVLYIFLFGVGSVAGMAMLSAAISVPLRLTARRLAWAHHGLAAIVGVLTIVVGLHAIIGSGIELVSPI
jgi:sulfite exporter TauE/SafE